MSDAPKVDIDRALETLRDILARMICAGVPADEMSDKFLILAAVLRTIHHDNSEVAHWLRTFATQTEMMTPEGFSKRHAKGPRAGRERHQAY
jgi:hypothetical protein